MKKILAIFLVLLLAAGMLSACNTNKPNKKLSKIMSSKKLVVGTSPDFAPMEFMDITKSGQDQYVGLDMEFARYIAKELGVELEIKALDFGALITAVNAGTIDLAISGFAWREDRAEAMELSDFYNVQSDDDGQGILIKKSDFDLYKTKEDFAGKLVAVQEASLQQSLLEDNIPDAEVKLIANINDGVLMLLSGKVDAVGVSGANGLTIVANYPTELAMSAYYHPYESEGNVVGIKKGEVDLCAKVNEIIKKAADAGLFKKWEKEAQELADSLGWQND